MESRDHPAGAGSDHRLALDRGVGELGRGALRAARPDRTRIDVRLTWEPEGFVEAAADKLGVSDRAVKVDLERFKEIVESRGVEAGAWRGEVVEGRRVD